MVTSLHTPCKQTELVVDRSVFPSGGQVRRRSGGGGGPLPPPSLLPTLKRPPAKNSNTRSNLYKRLNFQHRLHPHQKDLNYHLLELISVISSVNLI